MHILTSNRDAYNTMPIKIQLSYCLPHGWLITYLKHSLN